MRVERSIKNFIYGGIAQVASSCLSFLTRMVLIRTLGAEAVSLNGLFTEVIAMLSLAEMGVGTAITYNLYKPLRDHNEKKLAELINLFKNAYRAISALIFTVGLCILPYVHLFVSRIRIDLGYLRLVYFFFLVQTASSYLFSYKASLLYADQKMYIVSKYTMIIKMLMAGFSILILILTRKYLIYLFCQIITTLAVNILISRKADCLYPFLKRSDRLSVEERKSVFSNIRHLFIANLSGKITNSTDNILISMLVGTLHIAAYGSYSMLTNSFSAVMTQLNSATSGSVGNLMAEGDKRHMDEVLRRLTFVTYCPAILCANGVCCASTAFVSILFGKEYILPQPVVAVLSFNFFISLIKNPLWQMMQVSGLFARDKNISIAGSTINLILSVVLGSRYGIIGILLGTTSTYLVQIILKIKLLYRDFFFLSGGKYSFLIARLSLAYLSSAVLSHFLGRWFTVTLNIYQEFLIRGVISVVVAGSLTVLLFGHSEEMKYAVQLWKNIRKKFKGSKKGEQECQG